MNRQELIDNKIKLEPPEDTWNNREIKLEPLEIVKKELLDLWPKLETVELLEPKLEEIDYHEMDRPSELEYPDYLKLEPVEETDDSSKRYLPSSSSSYARRIPDNRKCSVCSRSVTRKSLTEMIHKDRRSVLMAGLVLSGRKTVEEANRLMPIKNFRTCRNHVSEAIRAIYKVLNIKNIHELKTRSAENMEKMMSTVNSIGHEIVPPACFEDLLIDLVRRIIPPNIDIEKPVQGSAFLSKNLNCSLCSTAQELEELVHIDNGNELVLAVGLILAGKKPLEEAKLLVPSLAICKNHLSEAVKEIFRVLNIRNMDELQTCSIENELTLMSIVKALKENCDFVQFGKLLESFIRKMDQHFIPAYIGNMRGQTRLLTCSICSGVFEWSDKFVVIEERNRKLVLLVGLVLGGRKTFVEAQMAMSTLNYPVCRFHLSETVDEIFNFLNIKKPDEMQTCSKDKLTSLMTIVQKLLPKVSIFKFYDFLLDFIRRIDS